LKLLNILIRLNWHGLCLYYSMSGAAFCIGRERTPNKQRSTIMGYNDKKNTIPLPSPGSALGKYFAELEKSIEHDKKSDTKPAVKKSAATSHNSVAAGNKAHKASQGLKHVTGNSKNLGLFSVESRGKALGLNPLHYHGIKYHGDTVKNLKAPRVGPHRVGAEPTRLAGPQKKVVHVPSLTFSDISVAPERATPTPLNVFAMGLKHFNQPDRNLTYANWFSDADLLS
jgi:hypothetical protein